MEISKNKTGKKVQQKVIFVFFACCLALGLAYATSKITFDKMLKTVDSISSPNDKLRLVSKVSKDIMQLDQIQRSQLLLHKDEALSDGKTYPNYIKDSETVLASLDSLKDQYINSPTQHQRIDSIKQLLKERNKLFLTYVQVRNSLIDNSTLTNQITNIDRLIHDQKENNTLITTQKTIKTTITKDQNSIPADREDKDERSFLAKLFGVKKKKETSIKPHDIVHKEFSIEVDTIHESPEKIVKEEINEAIQHLEKRRIQQSSTFVNIETDLTLASNILVNSMMDILYEVEEEAKTQVQLDTQNAQIVVNSSVSKISYILLASIIIMFILIYLILSDIRKSNSYRLALELSKEEAEYHSAAKQRFLSNMSHELRTPLQSIIGYTEQLKKSANHDSKIDVIYNASEHLLQIVNEVLDYNRIISGKFVFQNKTILISNLVDEVVNAMQQHADKKHLKINVEKEISGTGYILGDPFRLKQIMFNLISNAVKFTSKGTITVVLKTVINEDKTNVFFSVKDTGNGIPEKDRALIFNEFEQGSFHNSGQNFGSGLGLSIVKTLVEGMNGKVELQSTLNEGSSFTVYLTLLSSDKAKPIAIDNKDLNTKNEIANKVWIVDDDIFILELCSMILANKNVSYKVFSSPYSVLEEPFDPSVSHILMDMRMPGLSGKELNNLLRKKIPSTVKRIAFTAQALPEERSKILKEGFDGLLIKPFREAELLDILGISHAKDTVKYTDEIDLGVLPFIYDDPKELSNIINLFIKDTLDDLMNLKSAIKNQNTVDAEIIFHRLAGRSAQLGQERTAFNLRKCEIDTRNGDITPLEEVNKIELQLLYFIDFLINKEKITS